MLVVLWLRVLFSNNGVHFIMSSSLVGQQARPTTLFWLWIGWALLLVLADQLTKWWVLQNFQWGDFTPVTGFFNLVRAHNTGAAFSFLAGQGGWQRWLFVGIALVFSVFIIWQLRQHGGQRLFSFGYACLLGGAIGNVTDRLMHGYVVDFLDFHWAGWHFPAFNVADIAITVGVVAILLAELLRWRHERAASGTAP